jgi:hypothetical protein
VWPLAAAAVTPHQSSRPLAHHLHRTSPQPAVDVHVAVKCSCSGAVGKRSWVPVLLGAVQMVSANNTVLQGSTWDDNHAV